MARPSRKRASLWAGAVHKPWRDPMAETLLKGRSASRDNFLGVAGAMPRDAKGFGHNSFKIELAKSIVVRALSQATAKEALS